MRWRRGDESGIAMVTALLVSMVVLILGLTVVQLSAHNATSSAADRKRVQAIDAAEAGIDTYLSALTTSTGSATCNPIDADLPTSPAAHYHVDIQLFSSWPPQASSLLGCPPATSPVAARITSKGTAVTTGSTVAVSRTMQSEIKLVATYAGLGQAIFSDSQLSLGNNMTVNGYQGNDGDVYTNGDFDLSNNTSVAGSVYAQGAATIAQGIVKANVWAKNAVSLTSGIEVFGNVTSSTASISLSINSTIDGSAKAATTIRGGTVKGTSTPNSPSGPPPQLPFPQLVYNSQAWQDAGYSIITYSDCAAAKTFITAGSVGSTVVRITPACALSFSNNTTLNVKGNLAIITDGSITTVNQTNWNAVGGGPFTIFFIRPYQAGLNCTKPSPYDMSVANKTNFNNGNKVFVYSQCNVDFGNNDAGGSVGQIVGGTVTISNQMTLNYQPIVVPGFNVTGYTSQISYLREVSNA